MIGAISSLRGSTGYKIPNSLRFRSSASAYLSRTPTVAGNQTTWTWSAWVKRGSLGSTQQLFGSNIQSTTECQIIFYSDDTLRIYQILSNTTTANKATQAVYRDTSAWYHVVGVWDTTNATAGNRLQLYVNGQQITQFLSSTDPSPSLASYVNGINNHHDIGGDYVQNPLSHIYPFDGYMTEINFIDGQALTPDSFGAISPQTGVWTPKAYTGTYGTNGFYLKFTDNSAATSAAIGKDYSGNYNSWTPNNISLVAGSTYDSVTDSPTPYADALQYFTGTRYPYNALNFRSAASSLLSRTATPSNLTTWTWSGWVKRTATGGQQTIFSAGQSATYPTYSGIDFLNDNLRAFLDVSGTVTVSVITNATFTDTSAWYHVVLRYDSTQAVAANRVSIYVNGVSQTVSGTYPSQNAAFYQNQAVSHVLGAGFSGTTAGVYLNGYLAEVNFIDGQALDASYFGQTVGTSWVPKTYTGTYGTNGFYLKFNDNSGVTDTTMGKDSAGSNNWTPTNLAVTDVTSTDITSVNLVNPGYGLQFRSSASTYLSRTPSVAGNRTTWTWSGWVKRGTLGTTQALFEAGNVQDQTNTEILFKPNDDTLSLQGFSESLSPVAITRAVFRDTSAWYHIVVAFDSTNATASERMILYVNGTRQTLATYIAPTQNLSWGVNNSWIHTIGRLSTTSNYFFDGYMTEVNFIDGQALTPSSFGETINNTWVPKAYTGTYGTNGFYLNFADRSAMTATAIGNDASSNSNNWTPNNFAIADAIDYTATAARGNYATLNAIDLLGGATVTAGNALATVSNSSLSIARSTIACEDKSYAETQGNNFGSNFLAFGVANYEVTWAAIYCCDGRVNSTGNEVPVGTYATYTVSDVIACSVDMSTRQIKFYKNNVQVGPTITAPGSYSLFYTIFGSEYGTGTGSMYVNFGQSPFAYTPPAGFKALNTFNLTAPVIKKPAAFMAATTYTGTGSTLTITNTTNNTSFQPDFVWIKGRSGATDHALYDSVRGVQKDLVSNSTAAETTQPTGLTAFNSNGFALGNLAKLNTNAATYVAWQWKAGDSVVTNTSGTITSQVNANPTTGFSIVTYTGTGANATIGHGLGAAPKMVIVKNRSIVSSWLVDHTGYTNGTGKGYTALQGIGNYSADSTLWNNTAPTSTAINLGTSTTTNGSGNSLVAYCFAEASGYSKFGSYIGNGTSVGLTDGPFLYCGFKPRFVMIKRTDAASTTGWFVWDTSRLTANGLSGNYQLFPNSSGAETNYGMDIDVLSNGFKLRGSYVDFNTNGATYIFAAFAETPFKHSLAG